MRLRINIETGDLGTRAGVVHTTVERPDTINILVDLSRFVDDTGDLMRDLVIHEIDVGLYALTNNCEVDTARALMTMASMHEKELN